MLIRLVALAMLLGLVGCSSSVNAPKKDLDSPYTKDLFDKLDTTVASSHFDEQASNVKLAESAASVSHSLQELAKIERSVHNVQHVKEDPNIIQARLSDRTTVDWTGRLDTFLQKIAKTGNLQYRTVGVAPPIPVIVSVNEKDVLITDLIRNVAYQVQSQASVTLTKDKVIQLQYLKS